MFLLEQQGILANRLSTLREQHDALSQQTDGLKISELREAYRGVGRDLLRLLFFVEMNAIGLRKILKKFDKRFGYKFTNYYVKTRANHPYSLLQQVFKQVVICQIYFRKILWHNQFHSVCLYSHLTFLDIQISWWLSPAWFILYLWMKMLSLVTELNIQGIGAVVGAISRNLADLQDHQGSYISIYDDPASPLKVSSSFLLNLKLFEIVLFIYLFSISFFCLWIV